MKKILLRVFLILIILAVIGLYIYDYTVNDVPPTKNLFRGCSIICLCIAAFIRTFQVKGRNSLDFYEKQYDDILGQAFMDQPLWRKKLLCAVRLYNEDNFGKALKYLTDLKQKTQTAEDDYAVDLFAALCFTDLEIYEQAIHIYQHLISKGNANSRIFSNLGHVQMQIGEYKEALRNYELALDYDRTNAYAYNNIAQAHFQMHEFDNAIPFAEKALEYNPKLKQASSLLAIIYALSSDRDNAEKYFHIAITSGSDPKELKDAIAYFRTAQHAADEEEITAE